MDFPLDDLKARRRRRRRKQWIWESKRKIVEMDRNHPMRDPSMTDLLRARRAPLITLQYPLQQPLHSQPHIQRLPHPQPLLVGHPVPERVDTQGRTRYREPNMAHPPPSASPSDTKEWERETLVARMASLSNFRHHVPGDILTPDDRKPAPSTYMTLMYNLHYTLSATHYHAPTGHWVVHGTDSLLCIVLVLSIANLLRVHNKPFCPCLALQNQIVLNEFLHSNRFPWQVQSRQQQEDEVVNEH